MPPGRAAAACVPPSLPVERPAVLSGFKAAPLALTEHPAQLGSLHSRPALPAASRAPSRPGLSSLPPATFCAAALRPPSVCWKLYYSCTALLSWIRHLQCRPTAVASLSMCVHTRLLPAAPSFVGGLSNLQVSCRRWGQQCLRRPPLTSASLCRQPCARASVVSGTPGCMKGRRQRKPFNRGLVQTARAVEKQS